MQQTANLFVRVLWDGSVAFPRIRNYVDGMNGVFRNVRQPWQNGVIHSGPAWLGRFDPAALQMAEAMMNCVITSCGSPSITYIDNTDVHRIALAGSVMLARLRLELGQ
jgi:hypothetical protein